MGANRNYANNQITAPSAYIPIQNHYMPDGYPYVHASGMPPYPHHFVPNNAQIIKNYHLSLPNPTGDHAKLADLYEDKLPQEGGRYNNTSMTLAERLIIYNWVRDSIIKTTDGEEIGINDRIGSAFHKRNLLSYIKLLDLQPYHNSKISDNPYTHSGTDKMLMYRSCYPVTFDRQRNKVECQKQSIGLNLRIYDMSIAEYNVKKLKTFDYKEFNLWREVAFYEFVKENILKKKISPNFPFMYGYFLSSGTAIDFGRLKGIKQSFNLRRNKQGKRLEDRLKRKYDKNIGKRLIRPYYDLMALDNQHYPFKVLNNPTLGDYFQKHGLKETKEKLNALTKKELIDLSATNLNKPHKLTTRKELDLKYRRELLKLKDINDSMDKCLLLLTEAPNYNIKQWATKTYHAQALGPEKKMIRTGYHSKEVWYSIIFQLLFALQTMYVHKFTFLDMKLENNVYIKDLVTKEQNMGYWIYNVNDVNYYIPNYGYLVMIDSDFREVESDDKTFLTKHEEDKDMDDDGKYEDEFYKMYGNIDKTFETGTESEKREKQQHLDKLQYDNLKRMFDQDNFSLNFKNYGGIRPDEEIQTLFREISKKLDYRNSQLDRKGLEQALKSINDTQTLINELKAKGLNSSIEKLMNDASKAKKEAYDEVRNLTGPNLNPLEFSLGIQNGNVADIFLDARFNQFLHNRIGTVLSKDEAGFVDTTQQYNPNALERGKLYPIAINANQDRFKWVMFSHNDGVTDYIYDRTNPQNKIEVVPATTNLYFVYNTTEPEQTYIANEINLSESNLLETYRI